MRKAVGAEGGLRMLLRLFGERVQARGIKASKAGAENRIASCLRLEEPDAAKP